MSSNQQENTEPVLAGYKSPYKTVPVLDFTRDDLPTNVNQSSGAQPTIISKSSLYGPGYESLRHYLINWPSKTATANPGPISSGICDITGRNFTGTNLATQDYMSMCADEESISYLKGILQKGNFVGGMGGSRVPSKERAIGLDTIEGKPLIAVQGSSPNDVQVGRQTELDHLEATFEWFFDEIFWSGAQRGVNTRSVDEIKNLRSQGESRPMAKAYAKVFSTGWLSGYGCITGNDFYIRILQ
jgi:hypothetical protein